MSAINGLVLLLLCFEPARLPAQRYLFKQYGQGQGLENLDVNVMLSDRKGFLWLGTENGLFRYNGLRFEAIGTEVGSLYMTALAEDRDGRVWAGTNKGLWVSDPGSLTNKLHEILYQGRAVRVPQMEAIAIHGDEILVTSQTDQLLSFLPSGTQWVGQDFFGRHHIPRPAGKIGAIHVAAKGDIWLNCGDALYHIEKELIERFGATDSVPPDHYVQMLTDHRGGLWARGTNHVVYQPHPGERFEVRDGTQPNLLAGVYYKQMSEDREGAIITPTDTGLLRWEHGDWHLIGKAQGLSAGVPVGTITAADGSFWIGLAGQGLLKWLGYLNFESWTAEDGLSSPLIWGMARDKSGAMLFATERGLDRLGLNDHVVNKYRVNKASMPAHSRLVVAGLDETVWMSTTPEEVVALSRNGQTMSTSFGARVHHLVAMQDGKIWAATDKGLFALSIQNKQIVAKPVEEPLFTGKAVYNILCRTPDDCWVLASNSLLHLDQGSWHLVPVDIPDVIGRNQDLALDYSGNLWIDGTFDGVAKLSIVGDQIKDITFIKRIPLASNAVVLLRADRRGWLWVGGDHGVDVFNGLRWAHITQEEGLVWNDIDEYSFYDAPDGSIWIGTSSGITHVRNPEAIFNTPAPQMQISKASLGDQSLSFSKSESLPWTPHPLALAFAATDYSHDSTIRFHYRMKEVDADWVISRDGEIRYPQLAPGHYKFEVVAEDTSTSLLSQPCILEFILTPPWWKTWWAVSLCGFCILALIACVWRWRVNNLVERQRALERLVEERTQDLQYQATHDGMTGLWNRTAIIERLCRELEELTRCRTDLTVILLDFDHFKAVNDTYGHLVGDAVLREGAFRLQSVLRAADLIGRYGGEEFIVILPGCRAANAVERAEHLRVAICGEPFHLADLDLNITCSFGVASQGFPAQESEKLLNDADQALYRAKRLGRNRVEMARPAAEEHGRKSPSRERPATSICA